MVERWTSRRKMEVIELVGDGHMTRAEALAAHGISEEEFASWERLFHQAGRKALRSTRLQLYRIPIPARNPRGRPPRTR